MTEIKAGLALTAEEIEPIKAEIIEDDKYVFLTSTEISDGERTISVLYTEQTQGQGGLNIVDFFGFFKTDEALEKEIQSFEDVILHDIYA